MPKQAHYIPKQSPISRLRRLFKRLRKRARLMYYRYYEEQLALQKRTGIASVSRESITRDTVIRSHGPSLRRSRTWEPLHYLPSTTPGLWSGYGAMETLRSGIKTTRGVNTDSHGQRLEDLGKKVLEQLERGVCDIEDVRALALTASNEVESS